MNNNKLKKLTSVLVVSAGILAVDIQPVSAQDNKQSETQEKTVKKSSQRSEKTMSSTANADFINKAAESNLAEIELSNLALQNASSQQVKDFAQQMVDHHSMAQQELASIVSGNKAMHSKHSGDMSDKKSHKADDANTDDKNTAEKMSSTGNNSAISNASGATTGTGSTYSSGNASGASGTQGSTAGAGDASNTNTSGTTSSGTTDGTKAGVGTGSDYKSSSTGGGGAGANAGGTTSSTNAGTGSDPRKSENTGSNTTTGNDTKERRMVGSDSGDNSSAAGIKDNTGNNTTMPKYLHVPLSAEHEAIKNRLSSLSGTEFDRQYMEAMVKDHAKAVVLFEKQSTTSEDADLKTYAAKTLPVIKQHYQMAQKLNGMKNSGAKSPSN